MPDVGVLSLVGAQPSKPSKFAPISTQTFFTGLVTNRSPFNSLDNRYNRRFLGGRPDQLANGLNMEISSYGTLIRRPGSTLYTTQTLSTPILSFYSFHQFSTPGSSGNILVMADTASEVDYITPTTKTTVLTKSTGAGQTYFQSVGNTLYMGDGIDQQAWDGIAASTRNWGISIGSVNDAVGPTAPSSGITSGSPAWANPNNITTNSSLTPATVSLTSGTASANLVAQTFGFSIPSTSTINGIQVSISGSQSGSALSSGLSVWLSIDPTVYANIGDIKLGALPSSSGTVNFGGQGDTWSIPGSINSVVNNTNFQVVIQAYDTGSFVSDNFAIYYVTVTIYGTGGPTVTPTGSGTLSTVNGGWQYVFAYGNSMSGHISSTTPPSSFTGNFGGGINTSAVQSAGIGYAASDTGLVLTGNSLAAYTINTVNGSGAVLTYTISSPGVGYAVQNNVATITSGAQPGAGSGFTINITAVTGKSYVGVAVTASLDPQVNQIWVFRTKDGGAAPDYFALPGDPYPNTTTTIHDNSPDSALVTTLIAPLPDVNNPPPTGLVKLTYHLNRVWGVVGNLVYYSGGPDTLIGDGNEAFPPDNFFEFPDQVNRLIPNDLGLLVITTDDIFIIAGTTTSTFYSVPFQIGMGVLSYNAVDVQGSTYYLYTSDRRFMSLSSSGFDELSFAIGDQLTADFDPHLVYVAQLTSGTRDQCVFIADGIDDWYRCNPSQMPEGTPAWSPLATITGGATAVVQVETVPGVHQLLIGTSTGHVLTRDWTTSTDNGTAYAANVTLGSVVLAQPGQIALVESITTECKAIGSQPFVSVMLEEISGDFEQLLTYTNDPPGLVPSVSVLSNRFYLDQGQDAIECRHLQVQLTFSGTGTTQDELLTLSLYGALNLSDR